MECTDLDLSIRLNESRASSRLLYTELGGFGWLRFVEIERLGFTNDDGVVVTILLQTHRREDEREWSEAAKLKGKVP
ncbi:hypothetical protein LguiA_030524 [Lonicera macranthoides]